MALSPEQMWRDLALVKARADTPELRAIVERYEYILTQWMPKPDDYDSTDFAISRLDRLRRILGGWRRMRDIQKRPTADARD